MNALAWIRFRTFGAIAALLLLAACGAAPQNAAEQFLGLLGKGQVEAAYKSTAPQFQKSTSFERFRGLMRNFRLDQYESVSWSGWESATGKPTRVKGEITLRDGSKVLVRMQLIKIGEAWQVYNIHLKRDLGVKNPKVMKRLAQESLLAFNNAVRGRDFTSFHASLSAPMRRKYSAEQLQQVFRSFIDQNIDFAAAIKQVEPIFTKGPEIKHEKVLQMAGYYPTQPSRLLFALGFLHEGGKWRLVTFDVRVAPNK